MPLHLQFQFIGHSDDANILGGVYWWCSGKCKDICIFVYFDESIYRCMSEYGLLGVRSCEYLLFTWILSEDLRKKKKKLRVQTQDQIFSAAALKLENQSNWCNEVRNSSSLLHALWRVSSWPIQPVGPLVSVLRTSTVLLCHSPSVSAKSRNHRTFVNLDASVHIYSVHTDNRKSQIYRNLFTFTEN